MRAIMNCNGGTLKYRDVEYEITVPKKDGEYNGSFVVVLAFAFYKDLILHSTVDRVLFLC